MVRFTFYCTHATDGAHFAAHAVFQDGCENIQVDSNSHCVELVNASMTKGA